MRLSRTVLLCAVFWVIGLFGVQIAQAARPVQALSASEKVLLKGQFKLAKAQPRRGPKWGSIVVVNASELSHEWKIEIFDVNRHGRIRRRPEDSFTLDIAPQGSFRPERVRYGHAYLVQVTDLATAQVVLRQTYVPIRDFEGYALVVEGEGTDPRDLQIAQLQAQINVLMMQLAMTQDVNTALRAQINDLLLQIAELNNSAPRLSMSLSSSTPSKRTEVMGTTGVELIRHRDSVNAFDQLRTNDRTFTMKIVGGNGGSGFTNFRYWNGGTLLAGPVEMLMKNADEGFVNFTFTTPEVQDKSTSREYRVTADAVTYDAGGAPGAVYRLGIEKNSDVTVVSVANPAISVVVSGAPLYGNPVTLARSALSATLSVSGGTSHAHTSTDDVALLTLSASASGPLTVTRVPLQFQGPTVPSTGTAFTVDLINQATGTGSSQVTATYNSALGAWTATFNLSSTISAGESLNLLVRINSSSLYDAAASAESLSLIISGIDYTDGSTDLGLDPSQLPLSATVVYP